MKLISLLNNTVVRIVIAIALLVTISVPWIATNGTAALSFGALDLAEWMTIAPQGSAESPPLLTSALLRLPLLLIALLVALSAPHKPALVRWLFVIAAVALSIAQLPPLEFLSQFDNANYRQQAVLAIFSLIASLCAIFLVRGRLRFWFTIVVGIAGVISALWGLTRALEIMRGFEVDTAYGAGGFVTALLFGLLAIISLTNRNQA